MPLPSSHGVASSTDEAFIAAAVQLVLLYCCGVVVLYYTAVERVYSLVQQYSNQVLSAWDDSAPPPDCVAGDATLLASSTLPTSPSGCCHPAMRAPCALSLLHALCSLSFAVRLLQACGAILSCRRLLLVSTSLQCKRGCFDWSIPRRVYPRPRWFLQDIDAFLIGSIINISPVSTSAKPPTGPRRSTHRQTEAGASPRRGTTGRGVTPERPDEDDDGDGQNEWGRKEQQPAAAAAAAAAAQSSSSSNTTATMSSSIEELQRLSLVSKVCTELDNHLGLSDRTLAEFVIHLAEEFPEPAAFRHALSENGADFPDSLSDNLFRIIGAMKPSSRGSKSSRAQANRNAAPRLSLIHI